MNIARPRSDRGATSASSIVGAWKLQPIAAPISAREAKTAPRPARVAGAAAPMAAPTGFARGVGEQGDGKGMERWTGSKALW